MLTGTRSSDTWVHLTEPEEDVVTWNTSAQSLQTGTEFVLKDEEKYREEKDQEVEEGEQEEDENKRRMKERKQEEEEKKYNMSKLLE